MNRRDTLSSLLAWTASGLLPEASFGEASSAPTDVKHRILDSHIHLFDPTRAGGVAWPPVSDKVLYRPALPSRYAGIAAPMGVVGAIAIEASPLESDNDWVLKQVEANPILVGMVGNLAPGSASFGGELERLRRSPYFLGIRYGNLWDRDLLADWKKPGFVGDLKRLAEAGLSLDSANPDGRLVEGLLDVSQQVPELRIVIDHLPNATVPVEELERKKYWGRLRELGQNSRVFIKLSEVPVVEGGRLRTDAAFYREKLDPLWEIFGEDRVLFGSDWPNSDHVAGYGETLGIVRAYVAGKGAGALRKYLFGNSVAAYRWKPRRADQRLT
jgi:predicted TIM-barrel fold metal-dependent hydrolase